MTRGKANSHPGEQPAYLAAEAAQKTRDTSAYEEPLAAFTTVLNAKVLGPLTLAYVYAFAQFAMTWILVHLYVSRANRRDEPIDRARGCWRSRGRRLT